MCTGVTTHMSSEHTGQTPPLRVSASCCQAEICPCCEFLDHTHSTFEWRCWLQSCVEQTPEEDEREGDEGVSIQDDRAECTHTSGMGRRSLEMGAKGESQFSTVTLPRWLGDMVEEYVRTDLTRVAGKAIRKFFPGAVAVPEERPTKDEKRSFPGYDSSSFARFVKRVSNVKVNKLRLV